MPKITEDILRSKLKNWTLSAHLEKILNNGMSSSELKKQIEFYVDCGLVEKTGERRGLKYRYKSDTSIVDDLATLSAGGVVTLSNKKHKLTRLSIDQETQEGEEGSDDSSEDLSEVPENFNARHSIKEYTKEKEKNKEQAAILPDTLDIHKFLSWLNERSVSETSSISSFTISFKKTRESKIAVKVYSGITILKECEMSSSKFKQILNKFESTSTTNKEKEEVSA